MKTIILNGKPEYEVWLTRAIIFEVGGREISFEKENATKKPVEEVIPRQVFFMEKFDKMQKTLK